MITGLQRPICWVLQAGSWFKQPGPSRGTDFGAQTVALPPWQEAPWERKHPPRSTPIQVPRKGLVSTLMLNLPSLSQTDTLHQEGTTAWMVSCSSWCCVSRNVCAWTRFPISPWLQNMYKQEVFKEKPKPTLGHQSG